MTLAHSLLYAELGPLRLIVYQVEPEAGCEAYESWGYAVKRGSVMLNGGYGYESRSDAIRVAYETNCCAIESVDYAIRMYRVMVGGPSPYPGKRSRPRGSWSIRNLMRALDVPRHHFNQRIRMELGLRLLEALGLGSEVIPCQAGDCFFELAGPPPIGSLSIPLLDAPL